MIWSRFGRKIRRNKKLVQETVLYLNLKLIQIKLKITKFRSYPKLFDIRIKEILLNPKDNLGRAEITKLVGRITLLDKESLVGNRLI